MNKYNCGLKCFFIFLMTGILLPSQVIGMQQVHGILGDYELFSYVDMESKDFKKMLVKLPENFSKETIRFEYCKNIDLKALKSRMDKNINVEIPEKEMKRYVKTIVICNIDFSKIRFCKLLTIEEIKFDNCMNIDFGVLFTHLPNLKKVIIAGGSTCKEFKSNITFEYENEMRFMYIGCLGEPVLKVLKFLPKLKFLRFEVVTFSKDEKTWNFLSNLKKLKKLEIFACENVLDRDTICSKIPKRCKATIAAPLDELVEGGTKLKEWLENE